MHFRRRRARETSFDLTPMIDVTFLLLVFFIIVMKFKQEEQRHENELPRDEGPHRTLAEPADRLTLRMKWEDEVLHYAVDIGKHNSLEKGEGLIVGGTLQDLINDRAHAGNPHYTRLFNQVKDRLLAALAEVPNTKTVEIAMSANTKQSSLLHVDDTAPWGFVTLAVDACSGLNKDLRTRGKETLGVTFKNTEPASGVTLR